MHPIAFFLFLFIISITFAKMEIAVEGKHGWAEKLPTWRLPESHWASVIFFSGKPVTGYHAWMEAFMLSMFHYVYVFTNFSIATEMQIFAFFFFFSTLEDFMWFVLNPDYGIRSFRKDKIWWHARYWWGIAPRDYYIFVFLGVVLYTASLFI